MHEELEFFLSAVPSRRLYRRYGEFVRNHSIPGKSFADELLSSAKYRERQSELFFLLEYSDCGPNGYFCLNNTSDALSL